MSPDTLWLIIGFIGALLFFGRFYVQWLVSEWRGQYTIPVSFWYMSAFGALMLFGYAYQRGSPGGTFGLCFNIFIYTRNLVLVWREQGRLTPALNAGAHVAALLIMLGAFSLTVHTWQQGYRPTTEFWVWSAIWVVGQGVFFLRFFVQWLITEWRGKSIVPASFWYLSLIGLVLHGAYFFYRQDWLLAIGTVADGVPYARNLYLMRKQPAEDR